MARPKKDSSEKPAYEKLCDAFWEVLAQIPFAKITVKDIVARARVNKNTFYYHFSYLDELAHTCIRQALPIDIPRAFIAKEPNMTELLQSLFLKHEQDFSRIQLACSKQGSGILANYVRNEIQEYWYQEFKIDKTTLNHDELICIAFASGGITAVLGESHSGSFNQQDILHYLSSPFAQAAISILPKILIAAGQKSTQL